MEKQEKKEKKIITENRLVTITKRETSFEGLVSKFENGEDGIYNFIINDKQAIFQPKPKITKKDFELLKSKYETNSRNESFYNKKKKVSTFGCDKQLPL